MSDKLAVSMLGIIQGFSIETVRHPLGISINIVEGLGAYSVTKVLTYMVSDRPKQSLKVDY